MQTEAEIQAKCVWGQGPRDLLVIAENAFVFGPVEQQENYKDGCGWAKVHIDQAKALITQLQTGIAKAELLNDVRSANDESEK